MERGEWRVKSGVMVSPSAIIQFIREADTFSSLLTLRSQLLTPNSPLLTLHSSLLTLHSPLFTLHTEKERVAPLFFL